MAPIRLSIAALPTLSRWSAWTPGDTLYSIFKSRDSGTRKRDATFDIRDLTNQGQPSTPYLDLLHCVASVDVNIAPAFSPELLNAKDTVSSATTG